jgi:hypothetical protein
MSFAVWVTGPEQAGVETVADEVARRLAAREVAHEVLDARTPGIQALEPSGLACAAAFAARTLVRHGVAAIVAVPAPARAARDRARMEIGRMIEVHVCAGRASGGAYEPPERAEVEIAAGDTARGADQVLRTLEVLELLPRGEDRAYSDQEEREVIRRLKAFGYL